MPRTSARTLLAALLVTAVLLALASPVWAQAAPAPAGGAEKSAFKMFFTSSDIFGQIMIIVLVLMSMTVMSLAIQSFLANRTKVLLPPADLAEYERLAEEKQSAELVSRASTDPSMLGQVLHASLSAAPQGFAAMERTIEEYADLLGTERIRKLEYLNIMGAIGPMAGLFGTVYGMIVAFNAMVQAGGQPKPAELAAGVSTALVNTFWGLVVGIPAIVAAALARNHIESTVVNIMVRCEEIIAPFRPAKKAATPAAPARAAGPADRPVKPAGKPVPAA